MALDHFVPQVYLRQWVDDASRGLLRAIRKSDLRQFSPTTRAVCAVSGGSTNPYLQEPRAIEEFLKSIEPKYEWAVRAFIDGEVHREAIYVIAGLLASIMVCSPGGLRINAAPMKSILEEIGRRLDRCGKFPKPPAELGGTSFSELLEKGLIDLKINPKYPQAYGIISILEHVNAFGNFRWEFLANTFEDSPFFTSDYPVAIEHGSCSVIHRILPLTPFIAVRIIPDTTVDLSSVDFAFSNFSYQVTKLDRARVRYINRLIVQCAEDVVFHLHDAPWIPAFVEKHSGFRIEPVSTKIPHGEGAFLASTFVVTDEWE